MRGLPFFKGKKGPQFAGMNFSNDTSGGGGGGSYTLPTATVSRLGGVKIGSGINVAEDGTISASGGGGGGGYAISTDEVKTNFTFMGEDVYCRAYNITVSASLGNGTVTLKSGETQIKRLVDSSLCIESKIGNVYAPEVIKGFIKVTPTYGEVMWTATSAYNITDWRNGVLILYYTKNS